MSETCSNCKKKNSNGFCPTAGEYPGPQDWCKAYKHKRIDTTHSRRDPQDVEIIRIATNALSLIASHNSDLSKVAIKALEKMKVKSS